VISTVSGSVTARCPSRSSALGCHRLRCLKRPNEGSSYAIDLGLGASGRAGARDNRSAGRRGRSPCECGTRVPVVRGAQHGDLLGRDVSLRKPCRGHRSEAAQLFRRASAYRQVLQQIRRSPSRTRFWILCRWLALCLLPAFRAQRALRVVASLQPNRRALLVLDRLRDRSEEGWIGMAACTVRARFRGQMRAPESRSRRVPPIDETRASLAWSRADASFG
jgi:hypothetical protein